jgi:hypothetical protein
MREQATSRKLQADICFRPWPALPVWAIILLAGSFFYVWLRVEPLFEYHSYGPYFYRDQAFVQTFLDRPGGLASCAGVFLAQFNCLNWSGALVFLLSECAVFLTALFCLARISGRPPGFAALVPLFVLLLLRNRYGCPVPAMTIGLLLALAASGAHISLPWRRPWLSILVSGLISGLLFFLAGIWSALLFAVLCCLYASIHMQDWPAGLGCLGLALATPLLAIGTGNLEIARVVNPWPKGVDWVLAAALYTSVPVAGAVLALLPQRATTLTSSLQPVSRTGITPVPRLRPWSHAVWLGQGMAISAFLLGCAAVWLTFDGRQKLLCEIDYNASCGQYEALLAAARQVKVLDHPARVRVHLALYHTGRLAEELFSFHNMIEDTPPQGISEDWRAQSEVLFELGLVNDAEHMAHEALEMGGSRPDLLRLLARINLLKDRPRAAQVFLNVLSLIPFQGERPNDAWPTADPHISAAERASLARMRARMLTNEVTHDGLPMGPLLEVLLASHPTNQMAFEYLMAHYMMELDLKKAVERLRLLDNFNYTRIPRSYEEALLLYQQVTGVHVELRGRAIRPETTERFQQFTEAVRQFNGSAKDKAAMAANFGDTYWFYYYAARSRKRVAEGQASAP